MVLVPVCKLQPSMKIPSFSVGTCHNGWELLSGHGSFQYPGGKLQVEPWPSWCSHVVPRWTSFSLVLPQKVIGYLISNGKFPYDNSKISDDISTTKISSGFIICLIDKELYKLWVVQ